VQVDTIGPMWKVPGSKRLELWHDELLSIFAFNFNLRRYTLVWLTKSAETGLPSSMFNLARCLDTGVGVPAPDYPAAAEWYK